MRRPSRLRPSAAIELAAIAAQLSVPAPPFRGYRALVAAEQTRAGAGRQRGGLVGGGRRLAERGRAYPLAYALLRLAEAHSAAGDREPAAAAVRRAHTVAERIGAGPIAAEAAALARRARL